MFGKKLKTWLTPFNIALAYTVLGGAWILFADLVMADFLFKSSRSRLKIRKTAFLKPSKIESILGVSV